MKKAKSALLALSVSLVVSFILSCSSDGGGGGESPSVLKINGIPSFPATVSVIDYAGLVIDLAQFTNAPITTIIAAGTSPDNPSKVDLMDASANKFTQSGTYLVQVSQGTDARVFARVSFKNGSAEIDWDKNYYSVTSNEYVGSSGKPYKACRTSFGFCYFNDGITEDFCDEYYSLLQSSCPSNSSNTDICYDDEYDGGFVYLYEVDDDFACSEVELQSAL